MFLNSPTDLTDSDWPDGLSSAWSLDPDPPTYLPTYLWAVILNATQDMKEFPRSKLFFFILSIISTVFLLLLMAG